mmetsp:Transcript_57855/g.122726  ORF Transcript_57855/g.122726 Transcript_57855/m.122726 type:complete len:206 (-) Transcript_57855:9-626(-)
MPNAVLMSDFCFSASSSSTPDQSLLSNKLYALFAFDSSTSRPRSPSTKAAYCPSLSMLSTAARSIPRSMHPMTSERMLLDRSWMSPAMTSSPSSSVRPRLSWISASMSALSMVISPLSMPGVISIENMLTSRVLERPTSISRSSPMELHFSLNALIPSGVALPESRRALASSETIFFCVSSSISSPFSAEMPSLPWMFARNIMSC